MAAGGFPEQQRPGPGNQNDPEDSMYECPVCRQDFPKKYNPSRFGMLPNCPHIFCLPCERKLRSTEGATKQQKRRCPVCRTESPFVVPSNHYPANDTEKDQIIQNYIRNCGEKPCMYEEQKIGSCSRGSNCHYNHDPIVGMNLRGQVGLVQSLRMSKTNIRVNRNTAITLLEDVLDEEDRFDLDP